MEEEEWEERERVGRERVGRGRADGWELRISIKETCWSIGNLFYAFDFIHNLYIIIPAI